MGVDLRMMYFFVFWWGVCGDGGDGVEEVVGEVVGFGRAVVGVYCTCSVRLETNLCIKDTSFLKMGILLEELVPRGIEDDDIV